MINEVDITVILFGATGMLGRYVERVLSERSEPKRSETNNVSINERSEPKRSENKCTIPERIVVKAISREEFDIANDSEEKLHDIVYHIFSQSRGSKLVIVNCAGIIPQRTPLTDYRTYIRVNSIFPHLLSKLALFINAREDEPDKVINLIHITTDCVFNGSKGQYIENDVHTETNLYGVSKSVGEPEMDCVIRTSIIGEEEVNKKSLLEWVKSNRGGEIKGFRGHLWNGVTCLTLAKIIRHIIITRGYWSGVRHLYSPQSVSKLELCEMINRVYQLGLTITPHETDLVDKTLSTVYPDNPLIKMIPPLEEQLAELKEFI